MSKVKIWNGSTWIEMDAKNADTATKLTTARTIALTGDVTGSVNFDGSGNVSINASYKNSGAAAGTYKSVTVDTKGNVTAGTNPTTIDEYGIKDAPKLTISLPSNSDLNTVITSGFYRLNSGHINTPTSSSVDWGQMIVSRGSDTIFQFLTGYGNNEYYMRQGNPTEVGGTGSWQPWRKIWHDGNLNPNLKLNTSGGTITGTVTVSNTGRFVLPVGTNLYA